MVDTPLPLSVNDPGPWRVRTSSPSMAVTSTPRRVETPMTGPSTSATPPSATVPAATAATAAPPPATTAPPPPQQPAATNQPRVVVAKGKNLSINNATSTKSKIYSAEHEIKKIEIFLANNPVLF